MPVSVYMCKSVQVTHMLLGWRWEGRNKVWGGAGSKWMNAQEAGGRKEVEAA